MSNTLLATVIIAGVVGGSSAAVTAAMLTPSKTESREVSAKADLVNSDLAEEIAGLRNQNEEFMSRIVDLEMQVSLSGSEPRREPAVAAVDPELEQLKEEMAALISTAKGSPDQVAPIFEASVSTALANIREREDAERDQARTERRAERTEERLTELADKLGLNPTQVNDLRDHTLAIEEKRQALFAEARELGDFGGMRETMRAMRDESNAALQNIFSPAQYKQYEDENMSVTGGGRRGGGTRGGGATTGGNTNNAGGGGGGGGGRRGGNRGGF